MPKRGVQSIGSEEHSDIDMMSSSVENLPCMVFNGVSLYKTESIMGIKSFVV